MTGEIYVFDTETNGLLNELDTVWILSVQNLKTGELKSFSDYDDELPPLKEGLELLTQAAELIAHNQLTFDLLALEKVLGWKPSANTKLTDTLVYSQVLNYKRFGFGHSLKKWGEELEDLKVEHEDWSQYSPEMRNRCESDVRLNTKVYKTLIEELKSRKHPDKLLLSIEAEQAVSKFVGKANLLGWPFDYDYGLELLKQIEAAMKKIEEFINPQLRKRFAPMDAKEDVKSPAYVKNGDYAARTYSWFEIPAWRGQEGDRPIQGDYCRVQLLQPDIGSTEAVKVKLQELGWKPTEWNYRKNEKGVPVKTSPKLTDDSLEPLGAFGAAISEYYTLRARHSILSGWLEQVEVNNDGRLRGDCFVIGTPTRRSVHKIIANIPAEGKAAFGGEFRKLFKAKPGWKIVGTDSKGNQLRGLAHLIGNDKFTETILKGDIHSENRRIIETILGHKMPGDPTNPENDLVKRRDRAKKFIYAYLFGSGAVKTALICLDRPDSELGQKIKNGYASAVPGLKQLLERLKKIFDASSKKAKHSYILAIDSSPVFLDSTHVMLCYALQSFEKITVSLGLMLGIQQLEKEGIPYEPLIMMHDEVNLQVPEEFAEKTKQIMEKAFAEGPKLLGVMIMEGDSKIGDTWAEAH